MNKTKRGEFCRKSLIIAAGWLLAVSCTPQQLNTFLVGVSTLADVIRPEEEDISFFDWLEQELDD
jgi:hypothetical protein